MNTLEIYRRYDPAKWRVLPALPPPGVSLLLAWTANPAPVDGGISEPFARLLAGVLLSIGAVYFGGEPGPDAVARVPVRRGVRSQTIDVIAAQSVEALLPAFSTPRHDWSQNAQWLIIADTQQMQSRNAWLDALVRDLYQDWALPVMPPQVAVVAQAAVDGDGAACHCLDTAVAEQLIGRLRTEASAAGISIIDTDTDAR